MKFSITLTFLVVALVEQAFCCKCDRDDGTVTQSFNEHPVIVHGTVIRKKLVPFQSTMIASKVDYVKRKLMNDKERLQTFLSDSVYEITLSVKERFKGSPVPDTLIIYTTRSSCGVPFRLDRDYIVYTIQKGWHNHEYLTELLGQEKFEKENAYYAHRCTRTNLYDSSEAIALRKLQTRTK